MLARSELQSGRCRGEACLAPTLIIQAIRATRRVAPTTMLQLLLIRLPHRRLPVDWLAGCRFRHPDQGLV